MLSLRSSLAFAALASLATLASPTYNALAAPPIDQVSNVDDPGRIPYQSSIETSSCNGVSFCEFRFPAVPEGHRLVIQHVSARLRMPADPTFVEVAVQQSSFFAPFAGVTSGFQFFDSAFDQPVLLYVDAGVAPFALAGLGSSNFTNTGVGSQIMTLTGYLLDCTASPCAQIAPQ